MTTIHIPKLRDLHGLLVLLVVIAMLAMTCLVWFLPITWPPVATVRECDRQVAILFSTHDELELQRAMFLIRQLPCNIGKRL